jgi:hypothetical protein
MSCYLSLPSRATHLAAVVPCSVSASWSVFFKSVLAVRARYRNLFFCSSFSNTLNRCLAERPHFTAERINQQNCIHWYILIFSLWTLQVRSSCKASDFLWGGGVRFESRPGHQLPCLTFFSFSLVLADEFWVCALNEATTIFSLFTIIEIFRRHIVWVTDSPLKINERWRSRVF